MGPTTQSSHGRDPEDNRFVDRPSRLRLDPLGLVAFYANRPTRLLIEHLALARWLSDARADACGRVRARHAADVLHVEIGLREHEVLP